MHRFAAATLALAVLATASPAPAQTVLDYRTAVGRVPTDGVSATTLSGCLPVTNYVESSMAPWQRTNWGPLSLVPWPIPYFGDADPTTEAQRAACREVRGRPVIDFNVGSAEEIVTPPLLEEPDVLVKDNPAFRDMAPKESGAPRTGRRTPQYPMTN